MVHLNFPLFWCVCVSSVKFLCSFVSRSYACCKNVSIGRHLLIIRYSNLAIHLCLSTRPLFPPLSLYCCFVFLGLTNRWIKITRPSVGRLFFLEIRNPAGRWNPRVNARQKCAHFFWSGWWWCFLLESIIFKNAFQKIMHEPDEKASDKFAIFLVHFCSVSPCLQTRNDLVHNQLGFAPHTWRNYLKK